MRATDGRHPVEVQRPKIIHRAVQRPKRIVRAATAPRTTNPRKKTDTKTDTGLRSISPLRLLNSISLLSLGTIAITTPRHHAVVHRPKNVHRHPIVHAIAVAITSTSDPAVIVSRHAIETTNTSDTHESKTHPHSPLDSTLFVAFFQTTPSRRGRPTQPSRRRGIAFASFVASHAHQELLFTTQSSHREQQPTDVRRRTACRDGACRNI